MLKYKKTKIWVIIIIVMLVVILAVALILNFQPKKRTGNLLDMSGTVMGSPNIILRSFIEKQLPAETDYILWTYEDNSAVEDKEFYHLLGIFSVGKKDVGYVLLGKQDVGDSYQLLSFEVFEDAFADNNKIYRADIPVVFSMDGEATPENTKEVIFLNGRKNKKSASCKITGKDGDTSIVNGSGVAISDIGFCTVGHGYEPGTEIEIHYTDADGNYLAPVYTFTID